MALELTIEIDNSAVTASDWRTRHGAVEFPPEGGALITISLDGWVSEAARAAGRDPLASARQQFNKPCADAAEAEGLTKSALYGAVKTFPEFAIAVDV